MDIDKNFSEKLEKICGSELKSNFDASYIKGIFDAFQFVGGDLTEISNKQENLMTNNASELWQTMQSLSPKEQNNSSVSDLKLNALQFKSDLSQQSKKLKNMSLKLDEKKDEILQLRSELERKNIAINFKDDEITRLHSELNWTSMNGMNSNVKLRQELKGTKKRILDSQEEVHILRGELEKRNILLSNVIAKINSIQQS